MARSTKDQALIEKLRQQLSIANRIKQAAIDCPKSWGEILDELIWDRQMPDDGQGNPVPIDGARLFEFIARFPHYTRELQDYVERWNRGFERSLTPAEREALDLSPGDAQTAAALMRTLKWAQRIEAAETQSAVRAAALTEVAKVLMAGALTPNRVAEMLITIHCALSQKGAPE